ncbi:MAG: Plug domain-containing protein [Sphingobacteriales bacterium JAD_PAG50586_3]|nr:MAG: Plug domain-containing protein [Sphingobacteriales bacterium JAD_PAG50586_3]
MADKKNIYVLLCILCALALRAQTPADTVPVLSETQNLNSVEVRTYNLIPPSSRITNLSGAMLRNKGNTLTELLQENTGIYLKNYGPGMLSTIAFRGTGAEHTALVWNGVTINYPVLGLADFSTIPANGFSSVALQHGSSSINYGSSAIGGALLLSNPMSYVVGSGFMNSDTLRTSATFEAGSYGRYFGAVSNIVGDKKFISRTTAQWLTSTNNFNFVNTFKFGKPTERQVNSALAQRAFMQDFDFFAGASLICIKAWYNYTEREIPPTLTSNDTKAKQVDESIRLMADWQLNNFSVRGLMYTII